MPGFAVFLSQRGGPLSWQTHAREVADEAAAADRAAYAAERAISRCLPKLTTTSGQAVLNLRLRSLELLLQVSDLDADAFWDRAARVGTSYYRSCACREEDKGNVLLSRSAFEAVDAMYRRLVELAQNLSTTDDNKTQELKGKGFVHFCENWIQLSKKASPTYSMLFYASNLTVCTYRLVYRNRSILSQVSCFQAP